jgi:hypothetical protein
VGPDGQGAADGWTPLRHAGSEHLGVEPPPATWAAARTLFGDAELISWSTTCQRQRLSGGPGHDCRNRRGMWQVPGPVGEQRVRGPCQEWAPADYGNIPGLSGGTRWLASLTDRACDLHRRRECCGQGCSVPRMGGSVPHGWRRPLTPSSGCDLGTRYSVRKSACRWATFHSPPSRRYTWVARKVKLRG